MAGESAAGLLSASVQSALEPVPLPGIGAQARGDESLGPVR